MGKMPSIKEAAERQIDFLRYAVRGMPISEQRAHILQDVGKMKRYLKHPRGERVQRDEEGRPING